MASLNKVFLMGNLTRDPEVRYTPSGAAVGDLGLAVNRKFKSGDGEIREETCFVNVTVWGAQAENCAKYLQKGRPVMVEGRLKYDDWEKDGKKFNKLTVTAESVQFLGGREGGGSEGGSGGSSKGASFSSGSAGQDGGGSEGGSGGSSNGASFSSGKGGRDVGGAPVDDEENLPF